MKLFLDTSALIKLYHKERDSEIVEAVLLQQQVTHIFLSELTKIEFASAIWKKASTKEINTSQAKAIIDLFKSDFDNYNFIPISDDIISHSLALIELYGHAGLRTLDSIQFASFCVIKVNEKIDRFLIFDNRLNELVNYHVNITDEALFGE